MFTMYAGSRMCEPIALADRISQNPKPAERRFVTESR